MKVRTLGIAMVALGLCAGAALQSQAADILVVNGLPTPISPYFRSNCWDKSQVDAKPNEWVDFGTINGTALGGNQFTWTAFEQLLRAKCKSPKVRFTFTVGNELPPIGRGIRDQVTKLDFDASVPVYTITLGNIPAIVDVTPDEDDGDDD